MGGVDLWHNEDETYDNFDPQSMHDKILEVVSISGTWHLGKLQVKLVPAFAFSLYRLLVLVCIFATSEWWLGPVTEASYPLDILA